MSCKRFDNILSNLWYTNVEVPYNDGLLHMRQLEEFLNNDIMAENFFPTWINVLDKSMMESGSTSRHQDLFVWGGSLTLLGMSGIQFHVL
jgi:hypothetical protein